MSPAIKKPLFGCLVLVACFVYGEPQTALNTPISKLTDLAQQAEVLELAMQRDESLGLTEIFTREDEWVTSSRKPTKYLNKSMQYYFEGIIAQPGSAITELRLIGSQGETLAAYPTPAHYWVGNQGTFINVMADETINIENIQNNDASKTIRAQVSVPVKDILGEMFGVLIASIEARMSE